MVYNKVWLITDLYTCFMLLLFKSEHVWVFIICCCRHLVLLAEFNLGTADSIFCTPMSVLISVYSCPLVVKSHFLGRTVILRKQIFFTTIRAIASSNLCPEESFCPQCVHTWRITICICNRKPWMCTLRTAEVAEHRPEALWNVGLC